MGALGGIIDSAIGAATGSNGTTLQDFMNHFSSSEGVWIKQIDPIATFDLSFKFFPTMELNSSDSTWYEKLGSNLASAGMKAVKNAANNLTGGLLGSIMNSQVKIMENHDNFKTETGSNKKPESHTFMEYLAAANLLVGKDDWVGEKAGQSTEAPLELQLGLYCQEITVPQMSTKGQQMSTGVVGEFPVNGLFVQTDSNELQMKFINTRVPIFERIFYPWQREVCLPYWSYETQPYTTATITVDYRKHNDICYVFVGCRPVKLEMQNANQQASVGNLTRNVSFLFDYMFVTSTLTNCESLTDKLLSTGRTLLNGATKMMNA